MMASVTDKTATNQPPSPTPRHNRDPTAHKLTSSLAVLQFIACAPITQHSYVSKGVLDREPCVRATRGSLGAFLHQGGPLRKPHPVPPSIILRDSISDRPRLHSEHYQLMIMTVNS